MPVCFPYFDSPSVFARLLDKDIGGHFSIHPLAEQSHSKQQYLPNSAIISTKFLSDDGVCTITDFMPRPSPSSKDKPLLPWLVRRVEVIRGTLPFRLECFPGFDYARQAHTTTLEDDTSAEELPDGQHRKKAVFKSDLITMELRAVSGCNEDTGACVGLPDADIDFQLDTSAWPRHKGPGVVSLFTLQEGQTADFVFRETPQTGSDVPSVPAKSKSVVEKAPLLNREAGGKIISETISQSGLDPTITSKFMHDLFDAVSSREHLTRLDMSLS